MKSSKPRRNSKSKGKNSLIKSEKERKRAGIASEDEYRALLGNMKRPAQRVLRFKWMSTSVKRFVPRAN